MYMNSYAKASKSDSCRFWVGKLGYILDIGSSLEEVYITGYITYKSPPHPKGLKGKFATWQA